MRASQPLMRCLRKLRARFGCVVVKALTNSGNRWSRNTWWISGRGEGQGEGRVEKNEGCGDRREDRGREGEGKGRKECRKNHCLNHFLADVIPLQKPTLYGFSLEERCFWSAYNGVSDSTYRVTARCATEAFSTTCAVCKRIVKGW